MGLISLIRVFLYPAFLFGWLAYTKCIFLERSFDKEHIKQHKFTLNSRV